MRLEPLYRARFTTPESWSVELRGPHGTEAQNLLRAQAIKNLTRWATIAPMGIDPRPQEFRASWESILAGAGVDRADLGKYAGHSVQTANARYVQPLDRSAERVRSAIG